MLRESLQSIEPPCLPGVDAKSEFCDQTAQLILNQCLSQEEVQAKEDVSGIEINVLKLYRVGARALTGEEQQLLREAI